MGLLAWSHLPRIGRSVVVSDPVSRLSDSMYSATIIMWKPVSVLIGPMPAVR